MQKNDFVRIAYTGKMKETGQEFDKNDNIVVVVGAGYLIEGVDDALEGMNVGDKKKVDIAPEKGFGPRNPDLVKLAPLAEFKKHDTNPVPGMVINADNMRGRVLSVSSGRVKIDFNHPLAGKVLEYEIDVKEKIEGREAKIAAMVRFFTRLEEDKIKVHDGKTEIDITVPPVLHPAIKKRTADEIMKHIGAEKVRFSEIFEKRTEL